ncbi:hypothetical protein EJB05_33923 [Eragrostis curvula]|uniref:Uncharacterized protein n=1 Tax=Eragrostis curvula TaxID=38414 RepID=A0A5J9U2E8_9POAL|nr:hypothetical protein EJB05_33923 [Eragrostis curvula]
MTEVGGVLDPFSAFIPMRFFLRNPSKREAFFNSSSPACLLCAEVDGCVLNIWLNQEAPDERFQRLGGIQAPYIISGWTKKMRLLVANHMGMVKRKLVVEETDLKP